MFDIKNLNIDNILYKLEVAELYKQLLKTPLFSKDQKETPAAQQVTNEIHIFIAHRLQALLNTNEASQIRTSDTSQYNTMPSVNASVNANTNAVINKAAKKVIIQQPQDNTPSEQALAAPITTKKVIKQNKSARKTKKNVSNSTRYAQIKTAPGQIPQPTAEQLAAHYSLSLANNDVDTVDETTQLRNLLLRDELSRGSIKIKSDVTEE